VVFSKEEIVELEPSMLDALVAMSQPALDRYLSSLKESGILIYDSDLVRPGNGGRRAFGLPAAEIAREAFGRDVAANMIMLGCVVGLTGIASRDSLRRAISEDVPVKTVEMNIEAFEEGLRRAAENVT